MKTSVAILGSGTVAQTLAKGFADLGHTVTIGTRTPSKLAAFQAQTPVAVDSFERAAAKSDLVVVAVKGTAAESVVASVAPFLSGKVVIDTTNPIADEPPDHGVIRFFTGPNDSLMERLQKAAPEARFVKAYNSVGSPFMIHPAFPQGRPTMFICGNDADAKGTVAALLEGFGYNPEDVGFVESARALEPLCQLWCAPGFLRNEWNHAFALYKL
ncbi:MAG: NAD(P)-binding domain-containing protein [Myxococcales bacterium]|nr:NAD(P)-binding domain-containing protein [Myxococcales bacterium]